MQLFKPILSQETGCYFEYMCAFTCILASNREEDPLTVYAYFTGSPPPGGGGCGIPKYLEKTFQYTKHYTKTRVKYRN